MQLLQRLSRCTGLVLAISCVLVPAAHAASECKSSAEVGRVFEFDALRSFLEPFAGTNDFVDVLLDANSLNEELPEEEATTVFAYSNSAIKEASDVLSSLSLDELLNVSVRNVLSDFLPADDILESFEGQSPGKPVTVTVKNVLQEDLEVTLADGELFVTYPATGVTGKVIEADLRTCASVIHVIDAIFLPPAAPSGGYGGYGGTYGGIYGE